MYSMLHNTKFNNYDEHHVHIECQLLRIFVV